MSFLLTAVSRLCQQTIVWEHMTSRDQYGKPAYAAPVVYSPVTSPRMGGRRVYKTIRRSSGTGAVEFVQGSWIWLLATPLVGLEDRLYVFGDAAPYAPVLWVERYPDETGQEIYIKAVMGPNG